MSSIEESIIQLKEHFEGLHSRFKEQSMLHANSLNKITYLKIRKLRPICEAGLYFYKVSFSILDMLERMNRTQKKYELPMMGRYLYRDLGDISKRLSPKYGKRFKENLDYFKVSELDQKNIFDALNRHTQFWNKNRSFFKEIGEICDAQYDEHSYSEESFSVPVKLDWKKVYLLGFELGEIFIQISRALEAINNRVVDLLTNEKGTQL